MSRIVTVHNVIHPLCHLITKPDETRALIPKLVELARTEGPKDDVHFVLELIGTEVYDYHMKNRHSTYEDPEGVLNRAKVANLDLAAELAKAMADHCSTLFIGKTTLDNESSRSFHHLCESFLERRGLEFSDDLQIIGHGTSRLVCVPVGCENYKHAVVKRYQKSSDRVKYTVCQKTTFI